MARYSLGLLLVVVLLPRPAATLGWLTVAPVPSPQPLPPSANDTTRGFLILDAQGREIVIRGVNLEFEERNLPPPNGLQRPINASLYA